MIFSFSALKKSAQELVAENSAAILTGTGVVGVVTTSVLTGRATVKAITLINDAEHKRLDDQIADEGSEYDPTLSKKEKVILTWPLFIPPVASGATTIGAIIFAHRILVSKSAALAAAYGLSEKAFTEYKDKVLEKFGDKQEGEIRDEIAQDRVNANPPDNIIVIAGGDVLVMDTITGRYFMSTMETLKRAENEINKMIIEQSSASLAEYYSLIGLEETSYSQEVGWNLNNYLTIKYSTALTKDEKPCIVLEYIVEPIPRFDKIYD